VTLKVLVLLVIVIHYQDAQEHATVSFERSLELFMFKFESNLLRSDCSC